MYCTGLWNAAGAGAVRGDVMCGGWQALVLSKNDGRASLRWRDTGEQKRAREQKEEKATDTGLDFLRFLRCVRDRHVILGWSVSQATLQCLATRSTQRTSRHGPVVCRVWPASRGTTRGSGTVSTSSDTYPNGTREDNTVRELFGSWSYRPVTAWHQLAMPDSDSAAGERNSPAGRRRRHEAM